MRRDFEAELAEISNELIEMGALCEQAISAASRSLADGSRAEAADVKPYEERIDRKERDIETLCLRLILQQQPVARDLRFVSAALKMITDMERIGDQAADIADIVACIDDSAAMHSDIIAEMAAAAGTMVTESINSFVKKNTALAKEVIAADDKVDGYFRRIKSELVKMIAADAGSGERALDILMTAKYFERIADHAVNIAEWVLYAVSGERKGDCEV